MGLKGHPQVLDYKLGKINSHLILR